jgi:RNA recognition motif-containing protein
MGYAFVTFETESQATIAVEKMHKRELDGRNINLEIAEENRKSSGTRSIRGTRRFTPRPANGTRTFRAPEPRQGEPSETSMFVGNLPWSMDEEGLKKLFAAYSLADVRIIRRRNNSSKGFGFVEFATHADQQRALEEMKEAECEGRNLSIRVAVGRAAPVPVEGEEETAENQ